MGDQNKTKAQLLEEISLLEQKVSDFEKIEQARKETETALKESEERFKNLMDYIPGISVQGYLSDGTVVYWNKASEDVYGYTEQEAIGKNLGDLIIPDGLKEMFYGGLKISEKVTCSGEFMPSGELLLRHKFDHLVPVYSIHTAVCIEGKKPMFFCIDVDNTERKKAEKEREELLKSINEANREIDTLRELIPICSHCKKIRNDKGFWEQIETYLSEHFDTEFTHGICPECMKKYYHKKEI